MISHPSLRPQHPESHKFREAYYNPVSDNHRALPSKTTDFLPKLSLLHQSENQDSNLPVTISYCFLSGWYKTKHGRAYNQAF